MKDIPNNRRKKLCDPSVEKPKECKKKNIDLLQLVSTIVPQDDSLKEYCT